MTHEDPSNFMNSASANQPASEALLKSEIAFWREMIQSCDAGYPADSLERMNQALGLAEYRLLQLYRARA